MNLDWNKHNSIKYQKVSDKDKQEMERVKHHQVTIFDALMTFKTIWNT